MIRLPRTLDAWGSPGFREAFKQEVEGLDAGLLPLQQGLSLSSYVAPRPFQAVVLGTAEDPAQVRVKAGIFYAGIIAGCSCADDPTPVDEQTEYCVLEFDIDRATAAATVALLDE